MEGLDKTMNQKDTDHAIEPGQDLEIDLFRPDDAAGVARLFRIVYGDGYPIKTFLEPETLRRENAAGRTISTVARTPQGDIVGHNALYQSAPHKRTYESGAGLIHPAYRGNKGIFTGLIAHGQEVGGREFGIESIFGEPVCNHLLSQKACARQGWITHALEVDLMPAAAYDKEKSATGRVSALLDFKTIMPKPHRVYLPSVYEEALRFLYDGLDDKRILDFVDNDSLPDAATDVRIQFFDFAGVARIAIHAAGTDFADSFAAQERPLLQQGAQVIQVWINLSFPWVSRVVGDLKKRGYFLGGILPRWFDGDGLLMQKILHRPNWEEIQLHSERAGEILELVQADWEQTVNFTL
jgi:hypothetical protein